MRIIMLISNPFPPEEGIGYYTYNLSKKLIEKGHEITIITRGYLKFEIDYMEEIKIIKVPFLALYPFHIMIHGFFLNRIFKNIEKESDLIHIHTPLPPLIETSLPIVSTLHGSMIGNASSMDVWDLRSVGIRIITKLVSYPQIKQLLKKSKIVTTVSNPVKQEIITHYGFKDVLVMGNAVNEKKFVPSNSNKGEHLLYVGRLSYGKGLFDLLNAIKYLCKNKDLEDLKLLLVGKGELETEIRNYISKNKLNDNIKLLGKLNQDKLVKIYQNTSIFVFPSHYEGFPTVVLEAMSSGLPIILSDIPAHNDFIQNLENGLFFKKGSSEDLSEKILYLYQNESLKKKLGINARKTVEMHFTWEKISQKYHEIYLNLL